MDELTFIVYTRGYKVLKHSPATETHNILLGDLDILVGATMSRSFEQHFIRQISLMLHTKDR